MPLKKYLLWLIVAVVLILTLFFLWPTGSKKTEPKPLSVLTIEPTEKHSATVIFLHGLGDNASNWQINLRQIAINYPHIKFIIPQAPTISVSMNYGLPMPAWYNIKGNVKDIENLKQDKKGLLKTISQIEKIVQGEINNGIKPEKIIVAGHSQGGSVALTLGLTSNYPLAKIMCLSGFLPCREEIFNWAKEENKTIPFSFYHKKSDDLVPFMAGQKSAELLKEKGYQTEFAEVEENYSRGHFYNYLEAEVIFEKELERL